MKFHIDISEGNQLGVSKSMADYNKTTIKGRNARNNYKMYLSIDEQKSLVREHNESALYLMSYYLTAGNTTDVLNDSKVANSIGWNKQKVGDYRRRLVESKWIYFEKYEGKDVGNILVKAWFTKSMVMERLSMIEKEQERLRELEKHITTEEMEQLQINW